MARVFHHEALLRARLDLNLTQEELAAAVGVDVRTYRRYESGEVNDPRGGFSVRHPTRRRVIERLSAELGIPEGELLSEAPAGESAPASASAGLRPLHLHTLQRARHFVGRGEILVALRAWACAPRPDPRVLSLIGLGGAGKTALVERLLAELGDAPREGGVLVWSFYEDARIEAFLSEAVRYFAPGAASSPGERLARLAEALRRGPPHLLVLDGLEAVQAEGGGGRAHGEIEDPLLRRLLCALARGLGEARALVTSRFELTDLDAWTGEGEGAGARAVPLGALSEADAALLLRRWGVRGEEGELLRLASGSGGHALSVAVLGSYLGALLGGDPAAVSAAGLADAARDDPLARRLAAVLSAYARALPSAERDLLARLCLLPVGAEEDALLSMIHAGGDLAGAMAGWGPAELRRGLARLTRLGLVFASRAGRPSYSSHPFVREHFRSLAAVPSPELEAALAARGELTLVGPPRLPARGLAALDLHEALIRRLLDAGRSRDAWSVYDRSLGGFSHLGLVLGEMSRGARVLRAFAADDDPRSLPEDLTPLVRAELTYERGLYAAALGDLAFACRCYEAHNEIAADLEERAHVITGLRTLAYTERLRGALPRALDLVERSVASSEAEAEPRHLARGLALRAAILHDLGEVDAAARGFASLRALGDQPVARRALWEAEHHLALGRAREAAEATSQNLALCERLGWEGHASHAHAVLGRAAIEEGDLAAAAGHLDLARRWVAISGEVEAALRVHELAARIALAAGRRGDASREVEAGLHLAEVCGFGLARGRLAALAARE